MRFRNFVRRHPGYVAGVAIVIIALLAVDGWLIYKRLRYEGEISRLRAGMTEFERRRTDTILSSQQRRLQVMMQLIRHQARWDRETHLAVSVDSARMYLERDGAVLRVVPVELGPEKRVGTPPDTVHLAAPRGTRSVQSIVGQSDSWEVPSWVYADRGIPLPSSRSVAGALGPVALILDGGTVIYSMPSRGPLNDSLYVLPGSVRVRAEDLRAIIPSLGPGTSVYFY
jgi:hypothetical protein